MRNVRRFMPTLPAPICTGFSVHKNPLLSSDQYPRVEQCALIQQSTPTKYFCRTEPIPPLADI